MPSPRSSAHAGSSSSSSSHSSPTPSAPDRQQRERTRNAESQAALRARRRAHVEALEARLPQLESQLQTALADKAQLEAQLARAEEQLAAWRLAASPAGTSLESVVVAERRRNSRLTEGLAAVRAAVDEVLRSSSSLHGGTTDGASDSALTDASFLSSQGHSSPLSPSSASATRASPVASTSTSNDLAASSKVPAKRRRLGESSPPLDDLGTLSEAQLAPWLDAPLMMSPLAGTASISTPSASPTASSSSSLSVQTPSTSELSAADDFARRLLAHSTAEMNQDLRRARAASEASRKQGQLQDAMNAPTSWDGGLLGQSQMLNTSSTRPTPTQADSQPSMTELYGLLSAILMRCNSTAAPASHDWVPQAQAYNDARDKHDHQQALYL